MKRFIRSLFVAVIAIAFAVSCKKDDNGEDIAPPRDYAVQYTTEKADIEAFLKGYYIQSGTEAPYDIKFAEILPGGTQTSIWDQTEFPLQSKQVTFSGVEYTIYYLMLNQGVGDAPTRGDDILAAYRGTLITEGQTQFDYMPYPQSLLSLAQTIRGWQEILPLFKEGVYVPNPPSDPNGPPYFENYGAGVMFLPSALAYYNNAVTNAPAYSSMVFSFKLYRVEDADVDGDGLLNRYELNGTDPDPANFDSDGDGTPNYLDTDDDNDGVPTRAEVMDEDDELVLNPIPPCTTGGLPRHLDSTCYE